MLAPPASPFLPGTHIQYAWDSTSLGDLKTCPRKYYYTMICGWQPKEDSVHLRFGQEYHQAIQEYDLARADSVPHEDAIRDVVRNLLARTRDWPYDNLGKANTYKNRDTLLSLVVDYFDFFSEDTCKTHILANGKPAVELSFKFELDWGPSVKMGEDELEIIPFDEPRQPYLLCGHLDRVVDYGGSLFVLDHKTTTTTPSDYYFKQYSPSNQMTLYALAAKVIINSPIKGVIVEAAQILLEKPNRFIRDFSYRTPDQLDEWVADLHYWTNQAEAFAIAGAWPQNDTACDKFGGCKFREVCSKSPQVREAFLKADFVQLKEEDRWNPLKPR